LREILAEYDEIITSVENEVRERAVQVVISGDRPTHVNPDSRRYTGLDGRLSDLDSTTEPHRMPLISDRWGAHFRWRGDGPMRDAERQKLRDIVAKAHAAGRRVRFWATPEKAEVWQELLEAEVDLINTDDLAGLQSFLMQHQPESR
jgi:hypothetical protein